MQKTVGTLTGKAVRKALFYRKNGGHALPGLVVEKLFPNYIATMLAKLPEGVVIVTGTNGKTTTTKILVHLLKASGKRVLTNSTGSNLTRGIASSIAHQASLNGKLKFDIAVLEIDEATARRLVEQVKPRWVLGLNVSRDQLDRFGEVDTVASYINSALQAATEGVVINARDPHLLKISQSLPKKTAISYFGAADRLKHFFPSDYELAAVKDTVKSAKKHKMPDITVELADFRDNLVKYRIEGKLYGIKLKLSGQHNYLNGAAALALCRQLLPSVPVQNLVNELANVTLAFGRGEKYRLKNGAEIELVLVKNPASFTQALSSYHAEDSRLMIAINDNIADGRDASWLWDVNFQPLYGHQIFLTSGKRAVDMALRLDYDDIKVLNIEPNLAKAVKLLSHQAGPKVILATYTAMLQLYKLLSKRGWKL